MFIPQLGSPGCLNVFLLELGLESAASKSERLFQSPTGSGPSGVPVVFP